MTFAMIKPLGVALALSLLGGCTGLTGQLNAVSTPTDLYVLTPKSTFSDTLPTLSQQIVVETPTATAAVSGDQIAVQPTSLQLQYLPGVRWVDRAPLIVQTLLIESFENTNRVPAVGSSAIGLRADYYVVPDIREFQALVPNGDIPNAPLEIHVRLNIKLVEARDDRIIGSRSFEEFMSAPTDSAEDVVAAFDEALGDVMRDSIEWSIRRIAVHSAERAREDRLRMQPERRTDPVSAPPSEG